MLRPNKRPDIFSYRSSKKGPERIDHTFKTELYKTPAPEELGKTILRAELYIPGAKNNETAQILNSSTPKARELQKKKRPLEIAAFDVVKYKGKNVEDRPYKEKLNILREIAQKIPGINLPELASDPIEKRQLFNTIISGNHPKTKEGIVIYKLDESRPIKVKKREDYDVQIIGTYPAKKGSKYDKKGVGGFIGIPEGSTTPIRFGSGLTDTIRLEAFKNPDAFIGEWAKIKSQHVHPSGMHQAPIFKELRSEKIMNKIAFDSGYTSFISDKDRSTVLHTHTFTNRGYD